jgi:hypothetical protein
MDLLELQYLGPSRHSQLGLHSRPLSSPVPVSASVPPDASGPFLLLLNSFLGHILINDRSPSTLAS